MNKIVMDGKIFELQRRGGISRIYHELLPRICDLDKSIQFTILSAGHLEQELPQHQQIQHHALVYWERFLRPGRYFRKANSRGRNRAQTNWWRDNQADIWHSTYYTLPVCWKGPVIISAYDLIYERYPGLFGKAQSERTRAQMRDAVLAADLVICISQTTKMDFAQFYGIDPLKLQVIPLGIGPSFRKLPVDKLDNSRERPYLLYVGRRSSYKNFSTLLHAYSHWAPHREIDLLVIGSPWTREEVKQLRDLDLAGKVLLETAVSDQELARLYNGARAFIFPSLYEGFGLPILEAMACGCPIIASNIPSSTEVAGEVAYYFQPDSVEDLLNALDKVANAGRDASRVRKGIELAAAFTWEQTARQTLEVYHAFA